MLMMPQATDLQNLYIQTVKTHHTYLMFMYMMLTEERPLQQLILYGMKHRAASQSVNFQYVQKQNTITEETF